MQPFFEQDPLTLYCGDLREVLPALPENSVDFVCTDAPYGLSFMEKDWDHDVPGPEYWRAIARVSKPGALLLAFGGTRTYHHLTCAIEEAGWEIRDCLMWLYGQGFPKAADVGKMIDKAKGAVREVVGTKLGQPGYSLADNGRTNEVYGDLHNPEAECAITAPATPEAAQWTGWANALKPAWEPIVLAMKPTDGTLAHNALTHGIAGMNIDAARIGENPGYKYNADRNGTTFPGNQGERIKQTAAKKGNQFIESTKGRWPANLLLDEEAARLLDAQTGTLKSGTGVVRTKSGDGYHGGMGKAGDAQVAYGDSGGASRFFKVISCPDQNHNRSNANGAEAGFSRQSAVENSVLSLVRVAHSHALPCLEPFIAAMQSVLKGGSGCDTQLIQSTGERCVQESKHMLTERLKVNPVNCAEIQSLTNIITITQSLLSTDGFVDLVMSSNILRSWAVGEADSVQRFKYCGKATKKERGPGNDHPCVKPVKLMEYLLTLLSTPAGGVILDPFAGSGTTLLAAKRLGRRCIGIELTEHNCEIARGRLNVG